MKIAYIEIVGFRGFRTKTRFDFPSGFSVITGRNGVGKSTAFDALDFVLTGTISKYDVRGAKGGGLEEHLWWIGEKAPEDHYVSVGFTNGDGLSMEFTRRRDGSLSSGDLAALAPLLCKNAEEMPSWAETLMRTSLIRDETIAALSFDLSEQARFTAVRAALGAGEVADVGARLRAITQQAEISKEEQVTRHAKAHEELGRALTALTEARSAAGGQNDVAAAEKLIQTRLDKTGSGKSHTVRLRLPTESPRSLSCSLNHSQARTDTSRLTYEDPGRRFWTNGYQEIPIGPNRAQPMYRSCSWILNRKSQLRQSATHSSNASPNRAGRS